MTSFTFKTVTKYFYQLLLTNLKRLRKRYENSEKYILFIMSF